MKPVHFQHYSHAKVYVHTYCGLINFRGYRAWPFTRQQKEVTCKRCLWTLKRDRTVLSYKARLAYWTAKKKKKK